MANVPRVDDNVFGVDAANERNRAVTDAYEPGSIFKVVTIAGALSDGVTTPTTKYRLAPTIKVADRVIHEAHARGTRDVHDARDPRELLQRWRRDHRPSTWARTGCSSGSTASASARRPASTSPARRRASCPAEWSGSTIGNLPMGQGIAVTPLQMACAFAVLANRGVWVQPHVVGPGGRGDDAEGQSATASCPPRWRDQMVSMLTDAVEEGTGTEARIAGYKVAGKTGTAQKALPDGSGYSKSAYVASFVGIMPAGPPPARRPRLGRRAAPDLGRRRRGARGPGDRRVRPAAPRDRALTRGGRAGGRFGRIAAHGARSAGRGLAEAHLSRRPRPSRTASRLPHA